MTPPTPETPDRPVPQQSILGIAPYVQGRSNAAPGVTPIKLSANESPLGASPKAIAAYQSIADKLEVYPEGSSKKLRAALGEIHGLDPERIVCGAGSDEVLHLLAQAYLGDGDEAVMSQYGFSIYPIVTMGAGAKIIYAPETEYTANVDAMLAAVTPKTKMVFLANPNNPTGTYLPPVEVTRLHAGLRKDILLVIDCAYAEYVTAADYDVGVDLVNEHENVVMVRTFSKMGLAALRIGWMFAPAHIVDIVNRIRPPFNMSVAAQVAGVEAAKDVEFTAKLNAYNAQWRGWLTKSLASNRLRVIDSQANFILVLFPDEPGNTAAEAFEALLQKGLIVREVHGYGIGNGLRISIGDEASMRGVVEVLKSFGAAGAVS
jgi:histidinol-phosphate aminotransferase